MAMARTLVYGIGNPGRQDDALGVLCTDKIAQWVEHAGISSIDIEQNYQLNIEDAHKIGDYDLVIFADASLTDIDSFKMEAVKPNLKTDFTMHSVTPSFVLGLCDNIFHKQPKTYQLHIKAYKFEFMEKLTEEANENLKQAVRYLTDFLKEHVNP